MNIPISPYPLRQPERRVPANQILIKNLYASGKYTTEHIAKTYGITSKQVQRIAAKHGVIRTNAESNRLMAPLKAYHRMPKESRVQRTQLPRRDRYELLARQPWCTLCGRRAGEHVRLEIDHKDGNPANNDPTNLQVLCQTCNVGKSNRNNRNKTTLQP